MSTLFLSILFVGIRFQCFCQTPLDNRNLFELHIFHPDTIMEKTSVHIETKQRLYPNGTSKIVERCFYDEKGFLLKKILVNDTINSSIDTTTITVNKLSAGEFLATTKMPKKDIPTLLFNSLNPKPLENFMKTKGSKDVTVQSLYYNQNDTAYKVNNASKN
jgi:hypothetical protein